ncbi:MAG: 50S ribosomal protein L15 [Phycisphaeraceae bacterium]|nr:50S ribosomal protein L15 [Phycisphaeraceae bacterium]
MMIHELTPLAPRNKKRKRIGRGHGSGWGKQAGRGHKGYGSRRGSSTRFQFEGGQMPFFRRMPKMGFTNANFKVEFWTVNLRDLINHPAFARGGKVTTQTLIAAGLIRDDSREIKILGDLGKEVASLTVKLDVEVHRVTASARRRITEAGGTVNETGTRRDKVRGIDRNSGDRTPKNLTKKLRRGKNKPAPSVGADSE